MHKKLKNISQRVFGEKEKETDIIDSWNYLMLNYGWIPFEEFLKIDAFLVNELIERLNEMNEKNEGMTTNDSFRGRKRW